jgi:hypothetical protein
MFILFLEKFLTDEFSFKRFYINFAETSFKRDILACPSKLRIPEELWASGQPDNLDGDETSCAVDFSVARDKLGVEDINGVNKLNVICEV